MRFNHLHPPFDNPALRRAIIGAITQSDYMIAINGTDQIDVEGWCGLFRPGSPLANNAGMERITGKRDIAKVKATSKSPATRAKRSP